MQPLLDLERWDNVVYWDYQLGQACIEQIPLSNVAVGAKCIAGIATSYFESRAVLILTTTCKLFVRSYHVYQFPKKRGLKNLARCFSTGFYLLSLVRPDSPQWGIASLILSACPNLYKGYKGGKKAWKKKTFYWEKTPIAIAKGLSSLICFSKAHQAFQQIKGHKVGKKIRKIKTFCHPKTPVAIAKSLSSLIYLSKAHQKEEVSQTSSKTNLIFQALSDLYKSCKAGAKTWKTKAFWNKKTAAAIAKGLSSLTCSFKARQAF